MYIILEVALYFQSAQPDQGRHIHCNSMHNLFIITFMNIELRYGASTIRNCGVKLINKLPEDLKSLIHTKCFKARLKCPLVSKEFYSVKQFMARRWEQCEENLVPVLATPLVQLICIILFKQNIY